MLGICPNYHLKLNILAAATISTKWLRGYGYAPKPLLQLRELCSLQYGVLSTSRGAGGSLEIIQWAAQLPQNNSQRHVDYSC